MPRRDGVKKFHINNKRQRQRRGRKRESRLAKRGK